MQHLQLSSEDLQHTFQRAREIATQAATAAEAGEGLEVYIKAAEEVGIPREATLLALRERLELHGAAAEVGDRVFAPSMDGCWYPATLIGKTEFSATVEFIKGGEHTCAMTDLRPLSLIPGRKLQADLKTWGWWRGEVVRYDAQAQKVHVDCDGTKEAVSLHKLRLSRLQACPPTVAEQRVEALSRTSLMRCAALAGGLGLFAGLLLGRLLPIFLPFLR